MIHCMLKVETMWNIASLLAQKLIFHRNIFLKELFFFNGLRIAFDVFLMLSWSARLCCRLNVAKVIHFRPPRKTPNWVFGTRTHHYSTVPRYNISIRRNMKNCAACVAQSPYAKIKSGFLEFNSMQLSTMYRNVSQKCRHHHPRPQPIIVFAFLRVCVHNVHHKYGLSGECTELKPKKIAVKKKPLVITAKHGSIVEIKILGIYWNDNAMPATSKLPFGAAKWRTTFFQKKCKKLSSGIVAKAGGGDWMLNSTATHIKWMCAQFNGKPIFFAMQCQATATQEIYNNNIKNNESFSFAIKHLYSNDCEFIRQTVFFCHLSESMFLT